MKRFNFNLYNDVKYLVPFVVETDVHFWIFSVSKPNNEKRCKYLSITFQKHKNQFIRS